MKFIKVIPIVILFMAAFFAAASSQTQFEKWAKEAPLESVHVDPGQTATELIKARVPSTVRQTGDMTYVVSVIGRRQDMNLGSIPAEGDILLPIPYEVWVNSR